MALFGNLFGRNNDNASTPTQAPSNPAPAAAVPVTDAMTFDFSKGSAKLNTFDAINLTKSDSALTSLALAGGWDPANGGRQIDLDLSLHCYDANGRFITKLYFGNKTEPGMFHSGDNRTGAGDGDDETIQIRLNELNPRIARIDATVTSYTNVKFSKIANAYVRLIDNRNGREAVRYDISQNGGDNIGLHVGRLTKNANGEWVFQAVGQFSDNSVRSFDQALQG